MSRRTLVQAFSSVTVQSFGSEFLRLEDRQEKILAVLFVLGAGHFDFGSISG